MERLWDAPSLVSVHGNLRPPCLAPLFGRGAGTDANVIEDSRRRYRQRVKGVTEGRQRGSRERTDPVDGTQAKNPWRRIRRHSPLLGRPVARSVPGVLVGPDNWITGPR